MEQRLDNPAGRLHAILLKLKGTRGDELMGEVWKRALDLPQQAGTTQLLVRIGKVYALSDEIASKMSKIRGYHRRDVERWWKPLSAGFYKAQFSVIWNNVSGEFTGDILDDIESCSIKLSEFSPEPYLKKDELGHIYELLENIEKEIENNSDLDEKVKDMLEERLRRINQALDNVWINGAEPVQTELESAVANVAVESQNRPPGVKKVMEIVGWGLVNILRVTQIWDMTHDQLPALPFFDQPPAINNTPTPDLPANEILTAVVKNNE